MAKQLLHRIKANLYLNSLTDTPNDYAAKVISERSLNVADICKTAISRGGAPSTAEAMELNVNLFLKEMAYQLCDGFSVNTGYFNATPAIKGVFNSATETFNSAKHSLYFQLAQGAELRRLVPEVEVQVLGVGESTTMIAQVVDVKSGTTNELLTPGKNLKIQGTRLKLAGDHSEVGIYFLPLAGGAPVKVEAADIVQNNPAELIILIPLLPSGSYTLEVLTQYSAGTSTLKEPRRGRLELPLTVA